MLRNDQPRNRYRNKVERVVWTGRLAVILPTALFINVTLALWAGVAYIADKVRPASHPLWYQPYPSFQCLYASNAANYDSVTDIGLDLIAAAASPLAALSLAVMVLATILAIWAFFPVVLAEVKPPRTKPDGARLGEWLDSGLRLLRWSGRFFFIAVVILLPLGLMLSLLDCADVQWATDLTKRIDPSGWGLPESRNIMAAIGAALAGTTVALIAFSGRLAQIARRIRPVLDVALDVDNHLRERPLGDNPRARIAARYVSLLRHVCGWRGMNGEAYDALVIVAHSQGTVITADVLRFIRTLSDLAAHDKHPMIHGLRASTPMQAVASCRSICSPWAVRFDNCTACGFRICTTGPGTRKSDRGIGLKERSRRIRSSLMAPIHAS